VSSRAVRAAVLAVSFLLALVSAPGLAPAAFAESQPGSALAPASAISGYDISWPQCGRPYPATGSFGIVGVNNGIVYSANPCLADELAWAGGAAGELYANTANPGPALSTHWPAGQASPQYCDPTNLDSAACAYDYGYNAAADSFGDAVAAYASLGLESSPAGTRWWLDVETSNSWRSDVSLNVAALKGAVGYLTSAGVSAIGFYSTQRQWNVITGGSGTFARNVSWVAGASDAQAAISMCAGGGFTGGGVALVQYVTGGFDADVPCAGAAEAQVVTSIVVSPASSSVVVGQTQQFAATVLDQSGDHMDPQPAVSWSASGGGQVSAAGLFTAGSSAGGPFTVTASSGAVSGSATLTITPAPDFAVSVSPPSVAMTRGQTAPYQVSVTGTNGFTASASVSVSGLPAGVKATLSPTLTGTISTLTVPTSKNTRPGTYILTVTGKYGTMARTATATLIVAK
jgi:hypothetical protein